MSGEEELRFYAKYAHYYDEFTMKNNLPMAQFLLDKLISLHPGRTESILDLGAGTGIFSESASQEGFTNITLLDISEPMLNVAKTKTHIKDKVFIVGDITRIQLPKTYDYFVSVMMFNAIKDSELDYVLQKVHGHMNNNGALLLIEDKERPEYAKYFDTIEKGIFEVSKNQGFNKWFFVGRKRA